MNVTESDVQAGEQFDKVNVLVVEDDVATRRLLQICLEMEGYECTTLPDSEQVLEVIAATSPALVLVDYYLGNLSGLDLLTTVRRHEEYQSLPFIVMSATDHQLECELAGADGFIIKPFSLRVLLATIRELLDQRGAHKTFKQRSEEEDI